jgi:hypothetical protein
MQNKKIRPRSNDLGLMRQNKTYFCAAGAAGAPEVAPALADLPPSKKAFTQVVLLSNAK